MRKILTCFLYAFLIIFLQINLTGCRKKSPDVHPTASVTPIEPSSSESSVALSNRIRTAIDNKDFSTAQSLATSMITTSPKDPAAHYLMGKAYFESGNYKRARESFETALVISPENQTYIRALYECIMQMGDLAINKALPSEAMSYYKELLINDYKPQQTKEKLAQATILTSRKLCERRERNQAENILRENVQLISDNPWLKLELVTLLIETDRLMEADFILKNVVRDFPDCVDGYLAYADLLYKMGDIRSAQQNLDSALTLDPKNKKAAELSSKVTIEMPQITLPEIRAVPISAREEQDSYKKLRSIKEKLAFLQAVQPKFPQEAWIYYELSQINQLMGKFDEALENAEFATKLRPDLAQMGLHYALCLSQRGAQDKAMKIITPIEELYEDKLEFKNAKARILARLGEFDEAKKLWVQVLKTDERYASSLFYLGQLEMETGNNETAAQLLKRAVIEEPYNPMFKYFMGVNMLHATLTEKAHEIWKKDLDKLDLQDMYTQRIYSALGIPIPSESQQVLASKHQEQLAQVQPTIVAEPLLAPMLLKQSPTDVLQLTHQGDGHFDAHSYDIALEYARSGMFEQAIIAFEAVLRQDPVHFNALMNLGQVYSARNDSATASSYYIRALKIDPSNMYALKALANNYSTLGLQSFAAEISSQVEKLHPEQIDGFPKFALNAQLTNNARSFEPLTQALIKQGLYYDALSVAQTGIRERPNSNPLYLLQGDVLLQLQDYNAALDSYRIAHQNDLQNPVPLVKIGDLYVAMNRIPDALAHYKQALDVDYIGPDSMFDIVERYEKLGRHSSAKRLLNQLKTMNLNPDHIAKLEQHIGEEIVIPSKEEL